MKLRFDGLFPSFVLPFIYLALIFDIVYLIRAYWWARKYARKADILGYLRFDNILEIHIASIDSPIEFQRKVRKTIRYAEQHGYLIEFTSGMLSYGRIVRKYGDALISVRSLGMIGQLWSGGLASRFVGNKYRVTHPIKVVIDPSKIIGKIQR